MKTLLLLLISAQSFAQGFIPHKSYVPLFNRYNDSVWKYLCLTDCALAELDKYTDSIHLDTAFRSEMKFIQYSDSASKYYNLMFPVWFEPDSAYKRFPQLHGQPPCKCKQYEVNEHTGIKG